MNPSDSCSSDPIRLNAFLQKSRAGAALAVALSLSACTGFSPDGGMSLVADIAGPELNKDIAAISAPESAARAQICVERLLERPLTPDSAVQIALLNNRGLQAAYNELGIAETAMVKASLPPNPGFSFFRIAGPLESELEATIAADILALATLPLRAEVAADQFRQAQFRAAEETLRIATETRRNYYRAVAALEAGNFLAQVKSEAEAAAKLGAALGRNGAMNKLDQARQQAFYAETTARLAMARQSAATAREQLTRLLGLWDDDLGFKLPNALPAPPPNPRSLPLVEKEAVGRRVDLQIARIKLEALAKSYGLTSATRFIDLFELSGIYKDTRESVGTEHVRFRDFGPGATVQIPIFDFGEVRVRQADQIYRQALNHLAEKAVNVRSEARDAYRTYRSAYDIARHYKAEILPLYKIISNESLRRYNAMLIDVFALLTETRQRILTRMAAMDAKRDFWIAEANLQAAIFGGGEAPPADGGLWAAVVAESAPTARSGAQERSPRP